MLAVVRLVAPPADAYGSGLGAWTFDSVTTIVLLVLAVAVVVGARQARRRQLGWSPWRAASFAAGIVLALLTVDAWPGVYGTALMSVFVSQHLVLLLVCPLLLAYGRPQVPLRALAPHLRVSPRLARAGAAVTHPALGPLLVPVALSVVVFTALPADMARDSLTAGAVHLALLLVGFAIAVPFTRDAAYASSLAFGLALSVGLVELLVDAIPGIALRLNGHVLGSISALGARRSWGPSPLGDQQNAGNILWSVAEILDVPFLLIVLAQWVRADAREARRIDAALDRADREAALRRPVTVAEATGADVPANLDRVRPWWETDSRVFGDARTQAFAREARRRERRETRERRES